jgi:hypothetical protein
MIGAFLMAKGDSFYPARKINSSGTLLLDEDLDFLNRLRALSLGSVWVQKLLAREIETGDR